MPEHPLAALRKGIDRNNNSAILPHLVDGGHQIGPTSAFRPVLGTPKFHTKRPHRQLRMTSEAIAILLMKLEFCEQHDLVQPLSFLELQPNIPPSILYAVLNLSLPSFLRLFTPLTI